MTLLTSNRLGDLAQRIRQASDRAKVASVESAELYLEAGRLLIEAKAECTHGDWLPFLEMSGVHERQARRLMQLARSGLKADTVSDMGGVKAALEYLAEQNRPEVDPWEWAEQQVNGPFSAWDMEVEGWGWLAAKLMRQAKVPPTADFAITAAVEFKLPILRLVSTADLFSAMDAMMPITKGERDLGFDQQALSLHQFMGLSVTLNLTAKRIVSLIFEEIEYRGLIDDARYERERTRVHKHLMTKIDAQIAEHRSAA